MAIMGCGPGGSYLYSVLRQKQPELEVILFDVPHRTHCAIKGCAWGVNWPQFTQLCREANINHDKYLLVKYDRLLIDQLRIKADVAIIDKPSFIKDTVAGQPPINPSLVDLDTFDRVVDASGTKRAYLSPHTDQLIACTTQMKIVVEEPPPCPTAFTNSYGDYSWLFPIARNEVHLGSLSRHGIDLARQQIERVREGMANGQVICSCTEQIRCHGPILPFVEGKVWGLGEAIGLVDPISGAGIVPAMTSAKLMAQYWDSARDYEKQVWRNYSYMKAEARMVAKFMKGEKPSVSDLLMSHRAIKTLGVKLGFTQIINALIKPRKAPDGQIRKF